MERSLSERHIRLEESTSRHLYMRTETVDYSNADVWRRSESAEYIDFGYGASGDAISRLNAFEPYREPSLWADVLGAA